VVTSAAGDWSLSNVVWIFTIAIMFLVRSPPPTS
jgi:hypothetical protein